MIIRVNKTKDYTVMSNYHLKDKNLSLKAKGLLSVMLSLPDNWEYSISGLVKISKENETAITTALKELKQYNYLKITRLTPDKTDTGRIEYIYDIYEQPTKKQDLENLGLEIQGLENQRQYNTNNKITNNKNTKYIYIGEYRRVKLTEEQYKKLCKEFGKSFIDMQIKRLDEYVESNNNKNKYSNYNLVLRKAIRENWFKIQNNPEWFNKQYDQEQATNEELEEIENLLK